MERTQVLDLMGELKLYGMRTQPSVTTPAQLSARRILVCTR